MKTLLKAILFGTVAAGTFEVLRRTGIVQKVADKVQDVASNVLLHAFVEDATPDDAIDTPRPFATNSDGMYR